MYQSHGLIVKVPIVKAGSLEEFGFKSNELDQKLFLESMIRAGIPCIKHNANYLKEWKIKFADRM